MKKGTYNFIVFWHKLQAALNSTANYPCYNYISLFLEIMMEDKGDALAAFAEFIRELERVKNFIFK